MSGGIIPRDLTLPSGGVVTFLDPEDLTGADYRRAVTNLSATMAKVLPDGKTIESTDDIMAVVADNPAALSAGLDAADGTAVMLIEAWDIPYTPRGTSHAPHEVPIPADDASVLQSLRLRDYQAILAAVAPATSVLFGDSAPTPDDAGKPGSPTSPVGG